MRRFIAPLILLFVLAGCCCPGGAVKALKDGISVNKGHMADKGLPKQAREIAQDNYDLLNQVRYACDGTELPEDTATRMAVRKKAKEGK